MDPPAHGLGQPPHDGEALVLIGAGLAALVFGSEYLVQASVNFAKAMGVSDLIIGLTIVAAGVLPVVLLSRAISRAAGPGHA